MAVTERKSATERRDEILEAALVEFAAHGLDGGSTDAIAKAVGISQPYVFRLFGTKKQLFMATVERCLRGTLEMFHTASAGLKGEEALNAIGEAYTERLASDPVYLQARRLIFFRAKVSDYSRYSEGGTDVSQATHDLDVCDHLGGRLHGDARQPRRDDGVAGDPQGPARVDREPRMDG